MYCLSNCRSFIFLIGSSITTSTQLLYTDLKLGSELNSSVCGINTTHVQYTLQSLSDEGKQHPINSTVADNETNHTCVITITSSNPSYCQEYIIITIKIKGSYSE